MAPTKAELAEGRDAYYNLLFQSKTALEKRHYYDALGFASAAMTYVDGMMQFERRFENRTISTIECFDIIVRFAPPLFRLRDLDALAALLASQKRIERNSSTSYLAQVPHARSRLFKAYRLWEGFERQGSVPVNDPQLIQHDLTLQDWLQMGLVHQVTDSNEVRWALVTSLSRTVRAKCASCGKIAGAAKRRFLEPCKCPQCANSVWFTIVDDTYTSFQG